MGESIYTKWMSFAKNNEDNRNLIEHLVHQRNNIVGDELSEKDYEILETYVNAGIIASPPKSEGMSFFEHFLEEAEITLEELGFSERMLSRLLDGFIIPCWDSSGGFLFCINHNKERQSGLDAKYINIYPEGSKEILSNFKVYGLENTLKALELGKMYVCEGIFDKIRLEGEGLPAMTTLGSKISKTQIRILNRFDKIVLINDKDRAGYEWRDRILKNVPRVEQVTIPFEKDIDDLAKNRPSVYKDFIQSII